ncbi:MAG: antibiotic biosynthesis monooxygenase [Ruminococcaceae bacterium]|nr:antibiotic biosynthesis monooxygenase [Oscillospiraceae bacterium]
MYTIYVIFKSFPGKREAFIEKVKEEGLVDAIRAENGCIRYDYYFSEKDPDEILLIEAWETKEHQQIHINQPHMARLRAIKEDYIISTTLGEFSLSDNS